MDNPVTVVIAQGSRVWFKKREALPNMSVVCTVLIKFTSTDLDRNVRNDLPFIQTRNDRNGIISLKNTRFTAIRNTKARVTSRSARYQWWPFQYFAVTFYLYLQLPGINKTYLDIFSLELTWHSYCPESDNFISRIDKVNASTIFSFLKTERGLSCGVCR